MDYLISAWEWAVAHKWLSIGAVVLVVVLLALVGGGETGAIAPRQ